jgi:hypothetical protein
MVYPGGVLMTEAVSVPCATITDKTKVSSIDRAKNTVRLVFLSGVDKDQLIEYSLTGADVDPRIQSGDMPIMATCQGRQLLKLAFMPGTEPAEAPQPHHPIVPPKPPAPAQKPAGDDKPYNMKGILRKKQLDSSKDFFGFSLERIKDGKPYGDVKFYDLNILENSKTLIESLQTLQEGTEIDYVQKNFLPVKVGPKGSLTSFGGGFKRPYDPEAGKRMDRLNARTNATELLVACFEQYPISAHQDNYEKAVILYRNSLALIKEGEDSLMRGE